MTKSSNVKRVLQHTPAPAIAKPLTPLIVRLNYPFFPPGTSHDERQKTLGPYDQARSELIRRQLWLVDAVNERIRRLDEMPETNTPEFTQDVLCLAQSYGIDIEKALADAAAAPQDAPPSGTSGNHLAPATAAINRELLKRRKWEKSNWWLKQCLMTLTQAVVEDNNAEAAVALANLAQLSVTLLAAACAMHPEVFIPYASKVSSWPMPVDHKGQMDPALLKLLANINFARDTLETRIKEAQGGSEAREWARVILDTLERTRNNIQGPPSIPHMERLLEKDAAVTFSPIPEWALRCEKLPAFGPDKATLEAWKEVGAMMLRVEYPEFAKHKDWDRFKMRWKNMPESEKASRILDGIKKAMDTLAGARPRKQS